MTCLAAILAGIVNFCLIDPATQSISIFITSLLLGITGSAIVTLIIYSVEYNEGKTVAQEDYYISFLDILVHFRNLPYLHLKQPKDLVLEYFNEERNNDSVRDRIAKLPQGISAPNNDIFKIHHIAKDKFVLLLKQQYKASRMFESFSDDELNKITAEDTEKQYYEYLDTINIIVDAYIELSKLHYGNVENAYSKLFFFFDSKRKRCHKVKEIYDTLHAPQRDMLNKIKATAFHLILYKTGESKNLPIIIEYICRLQQDIFEIKSNESVTEIYNTFDDNLSAKLETFRARIYNEKLTKQENIARYSFSRL